MFSKGKNKEFFNQIFVKRNYLDAIINLDKYFSTVQMREESVIKVHFR